MSADRNSQRPYVEPANPGESRRVSDISERSGRHATTIAQGRGAGYLGDMQGFALPFVMVMIAVFVSVMRIWLGTDFPLPLTIAGAISACAALGFGIFLSSLIVRNARDADYIDAAKVKRVSTYLHIAEAMIFVVWLNWLTNLIPVTGAVSGPIFLLLIAAVIIFRAVRRRQTRRRQLWER